MSPGGQKVFAPPTVSQLPFPPDKSPGSPVKWLSSDAARMTAHSDVTTTREKLHRAVLCRMGVEQRESLPLNSQYLCSVVSTLYDI